MMTTDPKLYFMLHEETDYSPDYGQFVSGLDPVSAVERHYAEMDAWCSPVRDPDFHEEFCVWLYEIPERLAAPVQQEFEGVRGGEYTTAAKALLSRYPDIKGIQLNVILTAEGGATASAMPDMPHLLSGVGKG
jgi:hypothetical protein